MKTAAERYARQGIIAALLSAMLMGLAPIFGKQALSAGVDTFALVVLRTNGAAVALWMLLFLFRRQYIFIHPAGLIACVTAGIVNGIGSLMYYSGLAVLDASLAQILYTIHPLILALLLSLDGHPISRLTIFRMLLAFPAVIYLLTTNGGDHITRIQGMVLMLGGAFMYALHTAIIHSTLRDVPPQTVTLYTITAMALVVWPSLLFASKPFIDTPASAWIGIIGLTIVTIFSRLFLFAGIKHLGGLQAALLGLSELIVSVLTAFIFFGDKLSATQWIGAIALVISVAMVSFEKDLTPSHISEGWIAWVYRSFEKLQTSFYITLSKPPPPPPTKPSPLLKEIEKRRKQVEVRSQKID